MSHPANKRVRIYFGAHAPLAARINDTDGVVATQSDFSSIAYVVTQEDSDQQTGSGTLTIASVIDDTPSAAWKESKDLPNFNWDVPPANFDEPAKTYWVTVTYTFVGGFVDKQVWEVEVMPVVP